jgi:predicted outer membrane protein
MRQQMAENCIALTQAELMQTEKDQFDKAYMGQQICAHIGMLAEIKTLENYATGELKPIIQSVGKSTRQHLDQAKNICKQLETKTASRTERRNY